MNPNVPPMRSGRLTYIRDELQKRGQEVSLESVRKWFSGEAMPHKDRAEHLAEILRVDASWLMLGRRSGNAAAAPRSQRNGRRRREPRRRPRSDGRRRGRLPRGGRPLRAGAAHRPARDHPRRELSDSRHRRRGARERQTVFSVPTDLRNTVPIGVLRLEGFNFAVYEITDEAIELGTPGNRAAKSR
jgi:hypothetical protein